MRLRYCWDGVLDRDGAATMFCAIAAPSRGTFFDFGKLGFAVYSSLNSARG
jgi:hypothetical protein